MAVWIDIKYINIISSQLELFTKKQDRPYLANCRCPICGDSKKNRKKARGYFFTRDTGIFFKCHNCGVNLGAGNFLKAINRSVYDQWKLETYKERVEYKKPEPDFSDMDFSVEFKPKKKRLLNELLPNMAEVDDENEGKKYLKSRFIPEDRHAELLWLDNTDRIDKFKNEKYDGDSRIVIPFYNRDNELVGMQFRAVDPNAKKRFLTYKITDERFIYNFNGVNFVEPLFIVEGPFDSLFLPNAIAAGSSDFKYAYNHIPHKDVTLIFDNQPRNKEIVGLMRKCLEWDCKMFIWPEGETAKDINDYVIEHNGDVSAAHNLVLNNSHEGLAKHLNFRSWSKI